MPEAGEAAPAEAGGEELASASVGVADEAAAGEEQQQPPGPGSEGQPPLRREPTGHRRRILLVGGMAVAVLAVVASVVVMARDSGEVVLTWEGKDIDQADQTLATAEASLQSLVDQRHGATDDDTRCYFSLPEAGSSDVNPYLRCGPVLFVDGDPEQAYLTFPLTVAPDEAVDQAAEASAVRLAPASQPQSPDPTGLDDGEQLRRPDGHEPPDGAGGLEPPAPPRAEAGLVQVTSLDGIELDDPGAEAVIGSWARSYRLSGLGQPDRFGTGDEARRPAHGERFLAAQIQVDSGEATEAPLPAAPQLAIQVGDADPIPVPDELATAATGGDPVGLIVSVPQDAVDAHDVDLVVTDLGVEQRLDLTTGEPDPANVSVLRRHNRTQQLDARAGLSFTASAPGRATGTFTVDVAVPEVGLYWFFGADGRQHPQATDHAYLVPDTRFTWDPDLHLGPDTSLDPAAFTLELPDGTVVPATNLAASGQVLVVFDVPADFTTGTLVIGGRYDNGDGVTIDFGTSALRTPIEIPAG